MRAAALILTLLFGSLTNAKDPKVLGHISQIVSSDSSKDTEFRPEVSPYYRFRAIKYEPLQSESGGGLVVEKLYKGGVGMPYKVHFSKKIDLLVNESMKSEFAKMDFESKLGCCHPNDVNWDGFKLTYKVSVKNKYKCEIADVNKSQTPNCRLMKGVKGTTHNDT